MNTLLVNLLSRSNSGRTVRRLHLLVLAALMLLGGLPPADAQLALPLLTFSDVWKYDQSGADLGTAWREADYDDSAWPSGRGLLAIETTAYPAPFNTLLWLTPPGSNSQVITYYFRTRFDLPVATTGVALVASNLVDDGCVIYLNGAEAGRIRVPTDQEFNTFASSQPLMEGQWDVINLDASALRSGENVLAVEVHQITAGSADIVWGASVIALVPQPLVITNQPPSQTAVAGTSVTLSVGVAGGPVAYQWMKDGTNLAGATSASYIISAIQLTHAGVYQVAVSNALGRVTSSAATLTVVPDTFGPRLLAAVATGTTLTNQIKVTWDEMLSSGVPNVDDNANNPANYVVTLLGTTNRVPVEAAIYNPGPPAASILRVGTNNWFVGGASNYVLTVNKVRDNSPARNVIAPDSQIAIAWPSRVIDLLLLDAAWNFHAAAAIDPGVYDRPWFAPDYDDDTIWAGWWARGRGLFRGGRAPGDLCFGVFQTDVGFQPEPVLLRTTFAWPAGLPTTVTLRLAYQLDNGGVFYLNGVEILRVNVAPNTPIRRTTRSSPLPPSFSPVSPCATASVAVHLLPGTNWLAAALVNSPDPQDETVAFGLQLVDATFLVPGPLPESPVPSLQISPASPNTLRLSWTGPGYALESVPHLTADPASAPAGPWTEVPDMTNPFTNSATGPQRFFRLKK